MSANECSAFLDRAITKELRLYLVTPYNPVFFMIPLFLKQQRTQVYQSLSQILEDKVSSQKLVHLFLKSSRLKDELSKVCDTKLVSLTSISDEECYYQFDPTSKLFPSLFEKFCKLRKFLAQ